jgi:endogenous inhibitor of DNA gyrase (YacG/DUF329 family)
MTTPADPARPARTVPCPACGAVSLYSPANPARPFCSARCKQLDLGAWASEQFRMAAKESADDGEAQDAGSVDSRLQ